MLFRKLLILSNLFSFPINKKMKKISNIKKSKPTKIQDIPSKITLNRNKLWNYVSFIFFEKLHID